MVAKIKKGDKVKVIAGKDKGKVGVVLQIISSTGYGIVEGVSEKKHFVKRNQQSGEKGGIVTKEGKIHLSNLVVVNAEAKPVKIGIRTTEDGHRVRYDKLTDKQVD